MIFHRYLKSSNFQRIFTLKEIFLILIFTKKKKNRVLKTDPRVKKY